MRGTAAAIRFAPAISRDPRLKNFTISRLVTYSSLSHWMGKSSRHRVCFLQPSHPLHLSSGISLSGQQCGYVVLVRMRDPKLLYADIDTLDISRDQDIDFGAHGLRAELPVSDREPLARALDVFAGCVRESS